MRGLTGRCRSRVADQPVLVDRAAAYGVHVGLLGLCHHPVGVAGGGMVAEELAPAQRCAGERDHGQALGGLVGGWQSTTARPTWARWVQVETSVS